MSEIHRCPKYWWDLPGPVIAIADAIIQEWQKRRESGAPAIAFETSELAQFIAKLQPIDNAAPQGWQQGAAREIFDNYFPNARENKEFLLRELEVIISRHQSCPSQNNAL